MEHMLIHIYWDKNSWVQGISASWADGLQGCLILPSCCGLILRRVRFLVVCCSLQLPISVPVPIMMLTWSKDICLSNDKLQDSKGSRSSQKIWEIKYSLKVRNSIQSLPRHISVTTNVHWSGWTRSHKWFCHIDAKNGPTTISILRRSYAAMHVGLTLDESYVLPSYHLWDTHTAYKVIYPFTFMEPNSVSNPTYTEKRILQLQGI